jgi:iron-sulfur cluster repair protein YtfE (RIC family)
MDGVARSAIRRVPQSDKEGSMKATEMLKKQHREVEDLFSQVKKAHGSSDRQALLEQIENKLRAHMMIEETIFYPAVAEEVTTKKMQQMVPEAYEEHHVVQLVLDELPEVDLEDERFEAKMTVLEELVQHHVEEEEETMFPAAEKALGAEALKDLAEQMQAAMPTGNGARHPEGVHGRH